MTPASIYPARREQVRVEELRKSLFRETVGSGASTPPLWRRRMSDLTRPGCMVPIFSLIGKLKLLSFTSLFPPYANFFSLEGQPGGACPPKVIIRPASSSVLSPFPCGRRVLRASSL